MKLFITELFIYYKVKYLLQSILKDILFWLFRDTVLFALYLPKLVTLIMSMTNGFYLQLLFLRREINSYD